MLGAQLAAAHTQMPCKEWASLPLKALPYIFSLQGDDNYTSTFPLSGLSATSGRGDSQMWTYFEAQNMWIRLSLGRKILKIS